MLQSCSFSLLLRIRISLSVSLSLSHPILLSPYLTAPLSHSFCQFHYLSLSLSISTLLSLSHPSVHRFHVNFLSFFATRPRGPPRSLSNSSFKKASSLLNARDHFKSNLISKSFWNKNLSHFVSKETAASAVDRHLITSSKTFFF